MKSKSADQLYTMGEQLRRLLSLHEKKEGLKSPEFYTLLAISRFQEKNDCCTTGRLSEMLHVSKSAVSQTIHFLEEKALIFRTLDTADKRQPSIHLTEDGRKTLECAKETLRKRFQSVLEAFGEEKTDQFLSLLEELILVFEKA